MDKRGFTEALTSSLRAELARRKITQAEAALALGVSQSGMSQRLNGNANITAYELYVLAHRLDVPVDSLLPHEAVAA